MNSIIAEPTMVLGQIPQNLISSEPHNVFLEESVVEDSNIKISLFPSKRKTIKKINVVIEGEFNIKSVQLVKDNCQKLLQYYDVVNITLKNVTDIDLAAIQLIHVLNSSSMFMQKTITIESELSKDDKALILGSGLMEVMAKRKLI